jgi:DNA-directed RNA polymerase specialized sigma subunit
MTTEYLNNKVFEFIINRFLQAKKNRAKYELITEDLRFTCVRKKSRKQKCGETELLLSANEQLLDVAKIEMQESQKQLAVAFYTLSENIVRYAKFNLIDAEDAIQEGVMICFEKIDRFDPKKGKAFNYMTTCILNHFRQMYRTARNYNELKKKYHEFMQIRMETRIVKSLKPGVGHHRNERDNNY